MTFLDACLYSLVGFCVVFLTLTFLILVIKLISSKGILQKKDTNQAKEDNNNNNSFSIAPASEMNNPTKGNEAPGSAGNIALHSTSQRDAALIMAIVAENEKVPLNQLRFISIKEV